MVISGRYAESVPEREEVLVLCVTEPAPILAKAVAVRVWMKLRKTENAGAVMGKEGCNVFVVEAVPDTSYARIVTVKAD